MKTKVIRVSADTYEVLEQIARGSNKKITEVADILIKKGKNACKTEKKTVEVLVLE